MAFIGLMVPAFFACTCNALANMFWKMRFDENSLSLSSVQEIIGLVRSWQIWAGVGCYGISMLLFFYMLSNYKLSSIMPVSCMTYIFNVIIAKAVFHESISKTQIIGIIIIVAGLIVLSKETGSKVY